MSKEIKWSALFKDKRNTGSMKPLLLQGPQQIFDSSELMTSETLYDDSTTTTSTTAASVHYFKYQTEICSDWVLEITTGSGVWNVGDYCIFTLIKEIEIINSSQSLFKYTGTQLQEYLWFWNIKYGNDTKVLLKAYSDAGAGAIGATTIRCPILMPGQNGIFGVHSQPINLNLLKDALQIKITLNPGNVVSVTNALTVTNVRLYRRSWKMEDQYAKLYNKFSLVDFNYKVFPDTITQNIQYVKNIDDVFDATGVKEVVGLFVRIVANADVITNFQQFHGVAIDDLRLNSGNYDLYFHQTIFDGKYKLFEELGLTQQDSVTNAYQYFIPFSNSDIATKFENKGNPGLSFQKIHAALKITSSAVTTGTYYIYLSSVNKCTFVINPDGSSQVVY